MQQFSKIKRILSLVLLTGALWLVHLIQVFSFEESENLNTHYIPNNATSVYRLDGRVLTRELLASLLISEDEDLKKMAQNQIPTTEDGRLKPVGISFDSDILLFRMEENGSYFTGMLFNLWDSKTYQKNVPKLLGKNGAVASTDDVGVLLLQMEGNQTKGQLQKKAQKLLSTPSDFYKKHPAPEDKSLISVWYQEGNSSISDVGVSVQDNQLIVRGSFETKTDLTFENLAHYRGGFHLHSQWFPEVWSQQLQEILSDQGIEIPAIAQFSLNYFGTTIVTDPNFAPLPTLNAAFQFKENVEVDSIFSPFECLKKDTISGTHTYNLFSGEFEVTQLNERTIRVQTVTEMDLQESEITSIAEISGAPDYLLNIDGDKFISRILTLSNEYRAVSSLVKEINAIDIKMTPESEGKYRIYGTVVLNDDKWPLNELLKFLIRSKLLQ